VQQEQRQVAAAELQALAYCSLARSVVQACVAKPRLAAGFAAQLMALAAELAQPAVWRVPAIASSSSGNAGMECGLATGLAASMAARAYTAHVESDAAGSGVAVGGASQQPTTSSMHSSHVAACGPVASSSRATSHTTGGSLAVGGCTYPGGANCSVCASAAWLFITLCGLQCGIVGGGPPLSEDAGVSTEMLRVAAQGAGTSLQQYLQQNLQVLAWRNPVPYVCSNVLCGQLEGPSAVGEVRGPRGTLCGGCRAAWYCCEGCQRAAWEAHMEVCRASG
jgi:hypothetical protein